MKKRAFTLVEMLIVIFVVSVGLIVIIQGMASSHRYISETAQRTIALNLAKEGIEVVYNLRNTNRRRFSDKKDQCWLSIDSDCQGLNLTDSQIRIAGLQNGDICTYSFNNGYIPNTTPLNGLSPQGWGETISKWERDNTEGRFKEFDEYSRPRGNDNFQLIRYRGKWIPLGSISGHERGYYMGSLKGNPNCSYDYLEANTSEHLGTYYRAISIQGLFDKNTGKQLNCDYSSKDAKCTDDTPKELRFCSTVFYTQPYQGVVNICSIMTNFQK